LRQKILKNEPPKNFALAWILLAILALIWGSSFILIKKGLGAFTPLQVGTARISFAFIAMIPYTLKSIREVPKEKWKIIPLIGLLGSLIPAIFFAFAETELSSSLTGILNALTPIFTLIISALFFFHKTRTMQIIGLLLAFIGSIGLSFVSDTGGLGNMNFYVWFVVAATMMYAVSINLVKSNFPDTGAVALTALALFSVGPIALIILFSTDFISRVVNSPQAIESLICIAILGVIGTAFALILYNKLLQLSTPVFTSSVTYLIPFVAVLWGLIDGEKLQLLHYAGMIIVIAGIYIVNRSK
jgi:drug/metabolite transporter (DMT)-like permease